MSQKAVRASAGIAVFFAVALVAAGLWRVNARSGPAVPTIAFIPQTAGPMLWEAEHLGAAQAVRNLRCHIYWNTPTSEADVAGQVTLIERVTRGNYQGLVVAPNHRLSILSPLRRAMAAGLPVVVVGQSLDLPAGPRLGYIVNDDEKMGEMAAVEIARLIHGKGSVVIAGLSPAAPGVTLRDRGAERLFTTAVSEYQSGNQTGRSIQSHFG